MGAQPGYSRRDFLFQLSAGAGAAWLAANWPAILAAQEHAHRAVQAGAAAKFEFFSPEQATEVEAIAAQIIPTDDMPGAREARVVHFMDRALVSIRDINVLFFGPAETTDRRTLVANGLAEVQAKLKELFPGATRFSASPSDQQVAVLKALEQTPFFSLLRTLTILGFTGDPSRGGNYNKTGWQVMGFEDKHLWKPPFGYYDAEWLAEQSKNKP